MSQGTNERAPQPVVVVPAAAPQTAVVKPDDPNDVVVFTLPDGTEVSNDPRFFQKQQEKALVQRMESGDVPESIKAQVRAEVLAEIEADRLANEVNTGVAANVHTQASTSTGYDPDADSSDGDSSNDEEPDDDLRDADVNTLKAIAEEEEVDTSGVRKKSELKSRIRAKRNE